jgi:hypothetical protein
MVSGVAPIVVPNAPRVTFTVWRLVSSGNSAGNEPTCPALLGSKRRRRPLGRGIDVRSIDRSASGTSFGRIDFDVLQVGPSASRTI